MEIPTWFETTSFAVLGLIVLADLLLVFKRPHVPSLREAGIWVTGYVLLALAFAVLLWWVDGGDVAAQFVAGWITEYSLSVDNLFVFVIIMSRFSVPRQDQQSVLMAGIVISLLLRGLFILAGAEVISRFSWVFYFFGAFLLYTALQLLRHGHHPDDEQDEVKENAVVRLARRFVKVSPSFDGVKLRTRVDGRKVFTPMVLVFVAIGTTDLLFALDSIPAIFGLTRDPFIVFTATLFALMGLRQLYFLLGGLLERLRYLSPGLAVILGFIGIKLVLDALHENTLPFLNGGESVHWAPEVPIWLSLGFVVGVLVVTTTASLMVTRHRERQPVG